MTFGQPTRSYLPLALLGSMVVSGCAAESGVGRTTLDNNNGKADSVRLSQRLTELAPTSGFYIQCDGAFGCQGTVTIEVIAPSACEVLGQPQGCGTDTIAPQSVEVATVTLSSPSEGRRQLPFVVETGDGDFFSTFVSVAFTAAPGEEVSVGIEKSAMSPELELLIHATWLDVEASDVSVLERYLATIPGLTYREISTMYAGYRVYDLEFEQPLDHTNPSDRTFTQRAVLHHLEKSAPMVLYTSGYTLFVHDYLAEMPAAGDMNQLTTEQRFSGTSVPSDTTPADWEHMTITQAAADHHRLVEALKPFYDGSWLSTGHSKGGMASIFHRRFYPDDIEATVAYVTGISFSPRDPRYLPFLNQIGTEDCRERLRAVQQLYLERLDAIEVEATREAEEHRYTFEHAGGLRRSLEDAIVTTEWSFWQRGQSCEEVPLARTLETAGTDIVWQSMRGFVGYGQYDQRPFGGFMGTYNYQALRELGYQAHARGHLDAWLTTPPVPLRVPNGLVPAHDPSAMRDMQDWILSEGRKFVFIYGEHDPWTGGAYEIPAVDSMLRVIAPGASHDARIRTLLPADRDRVLDAIERWTGVRPALDEAAPPVGAPLPPGLLLD